MTTTLQFESVLQVMHAKPLAGTRGTFRPEAVLAETMTGGGNAAIGYSGAQAERRERSLPVFSPSVTGLHLLNPQA